ncbi:MAG: tRNA pseudouridine(38-40) synthase TruA [Spirochaetes bacterium]|nr:tRNA pseudouridine(38-40) synthase TruA [Spirochaetota bacterium]
MAEGAGRKGDGRIACIVQYDGSGFNGWQIQAHGRSVQGEIEGAVRVLTRETVRVVASGRTDAGVHSLGQVIHFDLARDIPLQKICIGLNGILPPDISIRNAYRVEDSFHARFDAVEREYRYYIFNYPQRTPFMRYRAMWMREQVDVEYLRQAAAHIIGEFDFSSFCKKSEIHGKNPVRRLTDIRIARMDELIEIRVVGNAFLHHMVRIIVGTMVEMSRGGEEPSRIRDILEQRDRDFSGITAPPYGLYLYRVAYDPPLDSRESAF